MSIMIEKIDGTRYFLNDLDIRVIDFIPDSPEIINEIVELDGGNHIVIDSKRGPRYLSLVLRFVGRDIGDYFLLMREVFTLFNGKDAFFLINTYESGLRWKVHTNGKYTPSRKLFSGDFTIHFICPTGIAESIGTSLDLQNRKEWDANLWQWGMGIDWDKEYRYQHNSNSFVIENIGTETIDPCEHLLEISLRGTFASQVKIRNITTGDEVIFNGSLTAADEFKLVGIRALKNGVSVLKNTNKKLITLAPGENEFVIEDGTVSSITFLFRFLYM